LTRFEFDFRRVLGAFWSLKDEQKINQLPRQSLIANKK